MAAAFQGDAFQSDTFETGELVTLGLINQTAATFTPALVYAQAITLGLVDRTAVAHEPSVAFFDAAFQGNAFQNDAFQSYGAPSDDITLGLIDQTAATFAPTVSATATISLGLIDQTAVVHAPSALPVQGISLALLDATATAFSPSAASFATISLGLIDQTAAAFSPSAVTAQTVTLGLIDRTASTFSPTVTAQWSIAVGLINQTAAASAPSVFLTGVVALDFLDRTAVAFTPIVSWPKSITFARTYQPATAFSPSVQWTKTVVVSRINATGTPFAPVVTGGAALQTIVLGLIVRTAVAFAPTAPTPQGVTLGLINQTAIAYSIGGPVFRDTPALAETLTDPLVGTYAVTGDFASFTADTAIYADIGGYGGWLKIVLTAPTNLFLATFGSGMIDTEIGIWADNAGVPGTLLYQNDDSFDDAWAGWEGVWSTIPYAPSTEPFITLPAGTYWVAVWPFEDTSWDTSEGPAILTITAYVGDIYLPLLNNTPFVYAPSVTPFTKNLTFARINRTAVASAPVVTRGPAPMPIISQPATPFAPSITQTYAPTPAPPSGSPIRIILEDTGDIAPIVVWRMCELNTAVSGQPSLGYITIRDIGQDIAEFILGKRITVDLGEGTRPIWTGYLIRAARRFWFSVDYPDTMQRQWRLHVVDINILFTRRVAYRKSDPANPTGPKYVTNTPDTTALETLIDDWLDLSADDLDTTTMVMPVGNINDGQVVYPWNGGMSMGEAVANIAQLPAAVYGINPLRQLVYADVDLANAPFILHDRKGAGRVGYREAEVILDGAALTNDALCWGAGKGSNEMVFKRLESTSSQALHGLWQDSFTSYAVWKQSTINKVADSIINGSPQSKRGHKDDRVEVRCVIHEHGLMVGDRVRFVSTIWGFDDVLPVRKMKLTFPTPWNVRYELLLSHEIDRWGFEDPQPPITIPGVGDIIIDLPPDIDIVIDEPCISASYPHSTFATQSSALSTGPWGAFPLPSRPWGATSWTIWTRETVGVLSFPGTDEEHMQSPGSRLNKVSGYIDQDTLVTVSFDAHDGHGTPPANQGVMGSNLNTNQGARLGVAEFNTTDGDTNLNWIYYWFGGTYNPLLTGSGTYRFTPTQMGTSLDSGIVTGGVGRLTIVNNAWGIRQAYSVAGAMNRDVVTGRFRFRFDQLATAGDPHSIEFTYGAARVELRPSTDPGAGQVELVTASGSTIVSHTAWVEDDWYVLEISLDLPNNTVRSRLWREATPGTIIEASRAADGERVGDGAYQPFIGIFLSNTSTVPYTFEMTESVSNVYAEATAEAEDFGGVVAATASGWGSPWYTRLSPTLLGDSPGITYASNGGSGTIRIANSGAGITGYIERPMGGGGIDIGFSLSGYTGPVANLVAMHFAVSGSTKMFQAFIGNTLQVAINAGLTTSGSTSLFNGQQVNVRVQVVANAIRLKVWVGTEPGSWTIERVATPSFTPGAFLWAIDTALSTTGAEFTIGPLVGVDAVLPQVAPVGLRDTGAATAAGSTGTPVLLLGRSRTWPFSDPGDGRAYAVTWGTDSWTKLANGGGPTYSASVVWGLFGDEGPGADLAVGQMVYGNYRGPLVVAGVTYAFDEVDIIVRGEIGMSLTGTPFAGGSGLATATAVIKSYDYGDVALPVPGHSEYFIGGGTAKAYFQSNLVASGGVQQWHAFAIKMPLTGNPGGTYNHQWGVEVLDALETVRSAGPLTAGFLLPNTGQVSVSFRNLTYEVVLRSREALIGQQDPCLPTTYSAVPDSSGSLSGQPATRVSSTVYSTKAPYIPLSLLVFVNGAIKRHGVDFTETSPTTFTFATPLSVSDEVSVLYSVDL